MPQPAVESHRHSACPIADHLAQIEQQCREQGIRLTPLRREVLALVLSAQKPIGAYELLAQLGRNGRSAAPPTVYRSLDFLMEQGFIHRLASINAYLSCCHPEHRHQSVFLICTECQRTDELSVATLAQPLQALTTQKQFKVQQSLIEISGLCRDCQHA